MIAVEQIGGAIYIKQKRLAEKYDLSETTMRTKIKNIEKEIQDGRYDEKSIIKNGRLVLINEAVFMDYLANEDLLKHKGTRKLAKPFRIGDWLELLGYSNITRRIS